MGSRWALVTNHQIPTYDKAFGYRANWHHIPIPLLHLYLHNDTDGDGGVSSMDWRSIVYPVMGFFRRKRLAQFLQLYPDLKNYSVLDVGGRPFIWNLLKEHYNISPKQLVLLNTPDETMLPESDDYTVKIADGRELPYEDKSFDLVFSNSVIEHVGTLEDMERFSRECERVGKHFYIQTPNHWFPLEPHLGVAFLHWLPRTLYRKLCVISIRYPFTINNPSERKHFYRSFDTTYLLTHKQLRLLFPHQRILAEKVLCMVKSVVVSNS